MHDICIPLPRFALAKSASVEVKVEGEPQRYNFRLVSFPWEQEHVQAHDEIRPRRKVRFRNFKSMVENYDKSWELVQIYQPKPSAETIQVLFRQKAA